MTVEVETIEAWYKIEVGREDVDTLFCYRTAVHESLRYNLTFRGGQALLVGTSDALAILAEAINNFGTGQADPLRYVSLASRIYGIMDEVDEEHERNAPLN